MTQPAIPADAFAVVEVDDGKYTFFKLPNDWRIHVYRHKEPWLVIESGSNAIAALMEQAS